MLGDANELDVAEPGRVVDQDPSAFGEARRVGDVSEHTQTLGDPGIRGCWIRILTSA
jgi:hypothetical protein